MSSNKITRQHILDAVDKIERENIELSNSKGFDVIVNGKKYPPKEVMRYANLLANGTKEWPYPGGEPTNKYLTELGFAVESRPLNKDAEGSGEDLIKVLRKIGRDNAFDFFDIADSLLRKLSIQETDSRIAFGTRSNSGLTLTIGQRYCLVLVSNSDLPWGVISDKETPSSEFIEGSKFDGSPDAYYIKTKTADDVNIRLEEVARAAQKELNRSEGSGYRKYNNALLEKAAFDPSYRSRLFDIAFGTEYDLTGNVWKSGCNWNKNKLSFYPLLKSRSIVIAVADKLFSPGDLVLITEGFKVRAIAKVLAEPESVTNDPALEQEFHPFGIEYSSRVKYAEVEWYELPEEEKFTYQVQQGIARVNIPEVRNRAIALWNDRAINFWIFQCNPDYYDFETAVKKDLLHDWRVAAHKDKIKKRDKVIIWLTGKRSGCYALARVTSNPEEKDSLPDDLLWKTEPGKSLTVGIELTHKLLNKPILWAGIKDKEEFREFNAGNQGTNFAATRKQYNALLELTEKAEPEMGKKIDLNINLILYGPPGTGKTYKLNQYKVEYFTDRGVEQTEEELLKLKLAGQPMWKVLGAVLGSSPHPLKVGEIVEHPLVKAWIKPSNKTNPANLAWGTLQSFADNESTQLTDKYRRAVPIFQKSEGSKWSILNDKRDELPNIIDQELLDLASNPHVRSEKISSSKTRYNFITFHQKYSYEDFIEGIKPLLQSDNIEESAGELQFELKKGIFYNSCLEALKLGGYDSFADCYNDSVAERIGKFQAISADSSKQFALFIDEINRANISAVFGELITLLEDDKRMGAENELWVELPYSNEKFCVPPNLYIIGTMNTADRSIALLDIALRRRFEFLSLYPEYQEGEWWSALLLALNEAIYKLKKNPDFFIGHAFFINRPETERSRILNTKIIPLLYEYCQNNSENVKSILSQAGIIMKETGIKTNFLITAE